MERKKPSGATMMISLKVPTDIILLIDKLVNPINGVKTNRTHVINTILYKALKGQNDASAVS